MRQLSRPASAVLIAFIAGCGGGKTTEPDLGFVVQAVGTVPSTGVAGTSVQ